jgi:hypothetical protein
MKVEKSSATFHVAGSSGNFLGFFSPFPGELFFRKQRICDRVLFKNIFQKKKEISPLKQALCQ